MIWSRKFRPLDDYEILILKERHNMKQVSWRGVDGKMSLNIFLKVSNLAAKITSENKI